MKRLSLLMIVALVSIALFSTAPLAAEKKTIAVITKIELAADGASATVKLKDAKTDEEIKVLVTDDLTLDKFKDHRIVDGDEIRLKYDDADGKNLSTYFRKTAGC